PVPLTRHKSWSRRFPGVFASLSPLAILLKPLRGGSCLEVIYECTSNETLHPSRCTLARRRRAHPSPRRRYLCGRMLLVHGAAIRTVEGRRLRHVGVYGRPSRQAYV